ncbi:UDP-N-acetylmuramate--L-alanine ligase [Candidatus Kuenenbacteria bacterium]|nr:UDP-N-acetylmuramate--L-alanine ligase [Candidatus Kuenenbacteria bacterium]
MKLNDIKKVHIIGIGGIGVSAVAKMMLKLGKKVTGSDLNSSEIAQTLKSRGVLIYSKHRKENLSLDTDLVIYSSAVPKDNPERIQAKILNIPQLSYPEFLGELSKEKYTIAISGTNGKSTTTSILGLILEKAKFDPLVIVGSKVNQSSWDENLRMGKSNSCTRKNSVQDEYFVVEACEWQANMLNLHPQIIVLTNIEEDHLDYYKDINDIRKTFQKYIEKLPKNGILIINGDDKNIQLILKKIKQRKKKIKIITFGQNKKANFQISVSQKKYGVNKFAIQNNKIKKEFILQVPGLFNIYNAVAASVVALKLGVPLNVIKNVLANFKGIWRRFEKIGEKNGAIIISDYAHTPTAISGTILAAKDFYPFRRIVVVFQPHHRDRTKKLFNGFIKSFNQADFLILNEIFDVEGREDKKDKDISSKDLIKEIKKRPALKNKQVLYAKDIKETKKLILKNLKLNDLILLLGAGDIYKISL